MDRSVFSSRPAAIGIAVAIAALAIGVSQLLNYGVMILFHLFSLEMSVTPRIVFGAVLQQGLVFGSLSGVYLWIRNRNWGWIGISPPGLKQWLWIASGWAVAFVSAFILAIVIYLLGLDPGQNRLVRNIIDTPETLLVMIPVAIVLIGPGEELLFRGIIQNSLRERFGPVGAIALASAIFALAHFTSLTGSFDGRMITIGLLFIPTLVFATAYERTGNLVVPALIHGLYNATLFSLQYIAIKLGGASPILVIH